MLRQRRRQQIKQVKDTVNYLLIITGLIFVVGGYILTMHILIQYFNK